MSRARQTVASIIREVQIKWDREQRQKRLVLAFGVGEMSLRIKGQIGFGHKMILHVRNLEIFLKEQRFPKKNKL